MKKTATWDAQRGRARIERQNRRKPGKGRPKLSIKATVDEKEKTQLGIFAQMLQNTIRINRAQKPVDNKYRLRQKTG